MGLALLIVILMTMGRKTGDEHYVRAARFWGKIFGVAFVMGVVTGIPMEFQFGTNWSRFSEAAGGVIGHTLAMEGVYAFFLESTFLGLFLYGEKLIGPRLHYLSAVLVWLGSWISGFFILVTNAWMQNPTGYTLGPGGEILLDSFWGLMLNPWVLWMYPHNMIGSVVTASFVMTGVGAFYLLMKKHEQYGKSFLKVGVTAGFIASVLMLFPTGDGQGRMVAEKQPVALAAMEGHFETARGAGLNILGQPDVEKGRIDNALTIPNMLSMMVYQRWDSEVKGLNAYPRDTWPDNIPLLYYSFHIMVGLGTIFILAYGVSFFFLRKGSLFSLKPVLWVLLLLTPFPYIANSAGWMTAELGRQPWLIYGLMRTSDGSSALVSAGNTLFTLLGFMGMYTLISILFIFLMQRLIDKGPESAPPAAVPDGAAEAYGD
jgi:cytochrome d ubiquinol oxidase subunit I